MQRVILQTTLWIMVLLDSNSVFGKAINGKSNSNSLSSKPVETPKFLEVQYDDYPVRTHINHYIRKFVQASIL